MTKPTHRLAALAAAVAVCPGGWEQDVVAGAVAVALAMGPDQAEVHRNRQDPDSGWCVHRTTTHWLLIAAGLAAAAWALAPDPWRLPLAIGAAAGWGTHALTDAMTLSGAALFGPVVPRPVHVLPAGLRFRTGGIPEKVLLRPALAVAALLSLASAHGGI